MIKSHLTRARLFTKTTELRSSLVRSLPRFPFPNLVLWHDCGTIWFFTKYLTNETIPIYSRNFAALDSYEPVVLRYLVKCVKALFDLLCKNIPRGLKCATSCFSTPRLKWIVPEWLSSVQRKHAITVDSRYEWPF